MFRRWCQVIQFRRSNRSKRSVGRWRERERERERERPLACRHQNCPVGIVRYGVGGCVCVCVCACVCMLLFCIVFCRGSNRQSSVISHPHHMLYVCTVYSYWHYHQKQIEIEFEFESISFSPFRFKKKIRNSTCWQTTTTANNNNNK